MIGNDRFVQVFGSVPAGDDTLLVQIVANAVREGFHIVLCEPGTATPVCTLPATKAKVEHECGTTHVLSLESILGPAHYDSSLDGSGYDPKERAKVRAKVQAIINRVTKAHGAKPNIGVIPGPSGYVVLTTFVDQNNGPTVREGTYGDYWWYQTPNRLNGPMLQPFLLVPPSTTKHGPLELIGQTSPAPSWLLGQLTGSQS